MSVRKTAMAVAAFALSASAFGLPAASAVVAPTHSDVSGVLCDTDASARVKPGQHAHERNEMTAKEVAAAERDFQARNANRKAAGKDVGVQAVTTIPVVFHVVTGTGGVGNVTDAQINAQIAEMNQDYAGGESSQAANTEFQFTLQSIKRWQNNNWFNDPDSAAGERALKTATHQGDKHTLNIWSTNTSYLGYATFPWWYSGDPLLDGIVIQYGSLPGGPITNYNLGKTATHESGHWLGLYHTFEGGCSANNDMVADTPAERTSTSGCPASKDTCPAAGVDPIHNYMDYSYDSCYNQYTPGQKARMQSAYLSYRA